MKTISRKFFLHNSAGKRGTLEVNLNFVENVEGKRTIDLQPVKPYWELSICGSTRYSGGQCISEIKHLFGESESVEKLCRIWERWHLNGMNAGTRRQTELVNKRFANRPYDYDYAVAYLKDRGAYEEEGYKYGYEWLVEYLPEDIINEVKGIIYSKAA